MYLLCSFLSVKKVEMNISFVKIIILRKDKTNKSFKIGQHINYELLEGEAI